MHFLGLSGMHVEYQIFQMLIISGTSKFIWVNVTLIGISYFLKAL
jgi:hypothetical protein